MINDLEVAIITIPSVPGPSVNVGADSRSSHTASYLILVYSSLRHQFGMVIY